MSGNEDILLDLADFLGIERAEVLVQAWLDSDPTVLHLAATALVEEAEENGDTFEAALIPELIVLCLTMQHTTVAGESRLPRIDALTSLANDDTGRLLDAKYLAGRARWYLGGSELPVAADLLAEAHLLAQHRAQDTRDMDPLAHRHALVRVGLCSYYLGKICKKDFVAFQQAVTEHLIEIELASAQTSADAWADALFRATDSCGVNLGRDDLRLLAERELIGIYPRGAKQEKITALARHCTLGKESSLSYFNIRKHMMSDLAMLYRNSHDAEDRQKAHELYDHCIEVGSPYRDHHRGMCLYLKSDLIRDELLEALSGARAAATVGDAETTRRYQERASELVRWGQELCARACEALLSCKEQGVDRNALTKAQRRLLLFSQGATLDRPTDGHELTEAAAVQHAEINHILLGFPLLTSEGKHPSDMDRSPTWENLERALNLILQMQADPEGSAPAPIALDDFLAPGSALVVPWQFSDNLSVQLFGCVPASDNKRLKPVLLQEVVVSQFMSRLRPALDTLLTGEQEDDYGQFLDDRLRDTAFDRLTEQLSVLQVPPKTACLRRAVVVRPRSNAEWVLPLEWLTPIRSETGEHGPALVELPEGVLWAGPGSFPLRVFQTVVSPDSFAVFATDQLVSYSTESGWLEVRVIDGVRELGGLPSANWPTRVNELTDTDQLVVPEGCEGVIVIGHADRQQRLFRQLESADWSGCRAVALLFCVSARYQLESGVFLRSFAGQLKYRLGKDAVVIASRVPVPLQESMRLAGFLLDSRRDPARPLVATVGEYLRGRLVDRPVNPFRTPWIVM